MKASRFTATLFAVALLAGLVLPASAQENAEDGTSVKKSILKSPLVGNWEGQWISWRSGGLTVVFVTETTGTLVATGTITYGEDPKPLSNVRFDERTRVLRFNAGAFEVDHAELSKDGGRITGRGWYQGVLYDVSLKKQ